MEEAFEKKINTEIANIKEKYRTVDQKLTDIEQAEIASDTGQKPVSQLPPTIELSDDALLLAVENSVTSNIPYLNVKNDIKDGIETGLEESFILEKKDKIFTRNLGDPSGQFVDCSTIDSSYTILKLTGIPNSNAVNVFNLADSSIRYIVKEVNNVRNVTTSYTDPLTCAVTTLYFFPYDDVTGEEIFKTDAPKESGIKIGSNNTMYLTKQRGAVFFIRFNEDLTEITEYFNTDEFLILFSYNGTSTTRIQKTLLNTWQPTTMSGYDRLITSYKYYDGAVPTGYKTPIKYNYLFNYPIHSPPLAIMAVKEDVYMLNTASIAPVGVLYFKNYNGTEYYKVVGITVYESMHRYEYEAVMPPMLLKKIISNFRVLSMSVAIGTDHDIYISLIDGAVLASDTVDTGLYNNTVPDETIKTEELGFYFSETTLHAITNVSYFDKCDNPIPTGYTPVVNRA